MFINPVGRCDEPSVRRACSYEATRDPDLVGAAAGCRTDRLVEVKARGRHKVGSDRLVDPPQTPWLYSHSHRVCDSWAHSERGGKCG
jgi:hypothetical protein